MGLSVFFAILILLSCISLERMCSGKKLLDKDLIRPFAGIGPTEKKKKKLLLAAYAVIAVAVGAMNFILKKGYLTGEWAWFGVLFYAVMMGLYVALAAKWYVDGSRFRELLAFAVVAWMLFYTTKAAAALCASLVVEHSSFWAAVVEKSPAVVWIATMTYCLVDMLKKNIEDHKDDPEGGED